MHAYGRQPTPGVVIHEQHWRQPQRSAAKTQPGAHKPCPHEQYCAVITICWKENQGTYGRSVSNNAAIVMKISSKRSGAYLQPYIPPIVLTALWGIN
jgi:hypothetical protein